MSPSSRSSCRAAHGAVLLAAATLGVALPVTADHVIPVPTGLSATVFGSDVWLTWDPYATTNFPADCTENRQIQISRNGSEIATTAITDVSYTDAGLANDTYAYQIRARCRIPAVPSVSPAHNVTSDWSSSAIAVVSNAFCEGAPTVSASASPAVLWPPNGKSTPLTVLGTVVAGSGCPIPGLVYYELIDEYEVYSESGSVEVNNGSFSLVLHVEASRFGYDLDGRTYRIDLWASAEGWTSDIESVYVLVPHDQRKR